MEVDDPHPSSSRKKQLNNHQNGSEQEEEERVLMDQYGNIRNPCIALMLINFYDPNKPRNQHFKYAPNIFARESIRENSNGHSTVSNMVEALIKYNEDRGNG